MIKNKDKHYSSETRELVLNLRLIDDDLFKVAGDDIPTCQEMLGTFLGRKNIIVLDVKTQEQQVGLKREIRLDARCLLENGTICNIEVQKNNINDDVRRTRFHNSIITVNNTEKGTEFKDIPNVVGIYISEYDVLKNGQRITSVRRCQKLGEEYVPIDDGELIIFANTIFTEDELEHRDNMSDVDRLLTLFTRRDIFYDERFPNISNRVKYLKKDEEGVTTMCKAVEEYGDRRAKAAEEEAEARGIKIGEELGKKDALLETARNMKAKGFSIEDILGVTGLSIEELEKV